MHRVYAYERQGSKGTVGSLLLLLLSFVTQALCCTFSLQRDFVAPFVVRQTTSSAINMQLLTQALSCSVLSAL